MKLLLIMATAITLAAAGGRSHSRHDRDRRTNLDYEDIETASDDQEPYEDLPEERSDPLPPTSHQRKSTRIGLYSIQVAKNKAQSPSRRHPKLSLKDSEASGTHYDGTATHYVTPHYAAAPQHHPQVQQIHTHELLANQGLIPIYNPQHDGGGNVLGQQVVLTSGLGVSGIQADGGGHHPQLLLAGGVGGHHQAFVGGHPPAVHQAAVTPVQVPGNDLNADITKSVYVFSAPPDPFDVPKQHITRVPQKAQKHYQVLFINSPTLPQHQHHVELPPPPELKTLVYVLVKKPQPPPPISFIQPQPPPNLSAKPEVYFIRYKNRNQGLPPHPGAPLDEPLPHPGLQYAALPPQTELRGNIDYGAELALGSQYEAASQHHPYAIPYQGDNLGAPPHLLQQRLNREIDAGVSGI